MGFESQELDDEAGLFEKGVWYTRNALAFPIGLLLSVAFMIALVASIALLLLLVLAVVVSVLVPLVLIAMLWVVPGVLFALAVGVGTITYESEN